MELVGRAEIVEDPDKLWQLGISVFERYNGPYTEELKPIRGDHAAQAGGGEAQRGADRELGPPQARPAVDTTDGVKFSIRQAVAAPPDRAMAAHASPAFYEGRPRRDDIAVREVVRHEARRRPHPPRSAVRLHGLGVTRRARRWSTPGRCPGSPGPSSCWRRAGPAGSCCPTTIPTGCSARGTYRFEAGRRGERARATSRSKAI